jgi:two-component system CheB/CheR fusion protein
VADDNRARNAAMPRGSLDPRTAVGIAASAARLDSLGGLLESLDPQLDSPIVVAFMPGTDWNQHEALAALRNRSVLPIQVAETDTRLTGGLVYVAVPGVLPVLRNGRIQVIQSGVPERGFALDRFFGSLARHFRDGAVAVSLAGVNGNGARGLRTVRQLGGLTIAEGEQGEPGANAPASHVVADDTLAAAMISERLSADLRHLVKPAEAAGSAMRNVEQAVAAMRTATALRESAGHDFAGYDRTRFLRRLRRRMRVRQVGSLARYLRLLRSGSGEVGELTRDLLADSHRFFRDRETFDFIADVAIPAMLRDKTSQDQVRIWVAGCGTGEEVYSLAALLCDAADGMSDAPKIAIFATDVDQRAIVVARKACYPTAAAQDVPPDLLARWFVRDGNACSVARVPREMCVFSVHDITTDVPFTRMDLVLCHESLNELGARLHPQIVRLFHSVLRPGGYLVGTPALDMESHPELFEPAGRHPCIFRRLDSARRFWPAFPLSEVPAEGAEPGGTRLHFRLADNGIARRAARVAERHAPAYVVVNGSNEVVHFSGSTEGFLAPGAGAADLGVLTLVHPDLRSDLRVALHQAAIQRRQYRVDGLTMREDGVSLAVNIIVDPVPGDVNDPVLMVVLFQRADTGTRRALPAGAADPASPRREQVARLRAEIESIRTQLRATTEELEIANRNLQFSREQNQSINEEMRFTNEELEASKEELQSMNKELQTVNGELAHRIGELGRNNADLKNLFDSTAVATIFLDGALCIKRFTPAMADIFHLIESDLGRPITDIASELVYDELRSDVRQVLQTLGTATRELRNPRTGAHYLLRILPYRSLDNAVAGVVLTFLDVTAAARAEDALRQSEERFRMMAITVPAMLFTADAGLAWDYVNPRFHQSTGLAERAALGAGWLAAVHPDDAVEVGRRLATSRSSGEIFEHEFRLCDASTGYRWYLARATAMRNVGGEVVKWAGSLVDIHERRIAEARQRLLFAELQHRVKNVLGVVRSIAGRTIESSASLEDFLIHFDGRLNALGRTQTSLARLGSEGIELEELIAEELLAHAPGDDNQVSMEGPSVRVGERTAEALGLAMHELATNAVKYGALAAGLGSVSINWNLHPVGDGERLYLEWIERTVPVIDTRPSRVGFGREFLERGLPFELDARTTLDFRPGGLRFTIDIPLKNGSGPKVVVERER